MLCIVTLILRHILKCRRFALYRISNIAGCSDVDGEVILNCGRFERQTGPQAKAQYRMLAHILKSVSKNRQFVLVGYSSEQPRVTEL